MELQSCKQGRRNCRKADVPGISQSCLGQHGFMVTEQPRTNTSTLYQNKQPHPTAPHHYQDMHRLPWWIRNGLHLVLMIKKVNRMKRREKADGNDGAYLAAHSLCKWDPIPSSFAILPSSAVMFQ